MASATQVNPVHSGDASFTRATALESFLLEKLAIRDCLLFLKPVDETQEGVLFIEPHGSFALAPFVARLEILLPGDVAIAHFCVLARLPRNGDGDYDLEALKTCVTVNKSGEIQSPRSDLPKTEAAIILADTTKTTGFIKSSAHLEASDHAGLMAQIQGQMSQITTTAASKADVVHEKPAFAQGPELASPPASLNHLTEILQRAAKSEKGCVFIDSRGQRNRVTYASLAEKAARVAAGLKKAGIVAGDKLILQCDAGEIFTTAFWACVWLGAIPAPMALAPSYRQKSHATSKLLNAWRLLDNATILCDRKLKPDIVALGEREACEGWRVLGVENLASDETTPAFDARPTDMTLLLLTSGSTGIPKAVPQTHESLLSMSAGSIAMNGFSAADVTYNWMPMDHVGALVFLGIMAVDLRADQVHAPINYILQNPLRWIEDLSHFSATISWAPNFAFGLILNLEKALREHKPDLSRMRFLVNAGEAVAAKTMRAFIRLLEEFGLPSKALKPAFGMSETCSGITWSHGFTLTNSSDEDRFVNLGPVIPNTAMRVVDPSQKMLQEGEIGRVQFKGPSITKGYYANPKMNRELFSEDGWFTTGDLGFLKDACLYITGREKDEIVINGVNFYCHELEIIVASVPGVVASYTAATAVSIAGDVEEKLALFFHTELEKSWELAALLERIRGTLARQIGIKPHFLVPLKTDQIPKTGIGKIQRSQLRNAFEQGAFDDLLTCWDMAPWGTNLLPQWFSKPVWEKLNGRPITASTRRPRIIGWIGDETQATALTKAMASIQAECQVTQLDLAAMDFGAASLGSLLRKACDGGGGLTHVVFWPGRLPALDCEPLEKVVAMVAALGRLVTLLKDSNAGFSKIRLWVATESAFEIEAEDHADPSQAVLPGMVASLNRECDWIRATLIDGQNSALAYAIAKEMGLGQETSEIAYRGESRFARFLAPVVPRKQVDSLCIKNGGRYVITGGLGVLGTSLARLLLIGYQAKLLIVGTTTTEAMATDPVAGIKRENLTRLRHLSAKVHYQSVDVADAAALENAVTQFERSMGGPVDGMFHLASRFHQQSMVEHTRESVRAVIGSKWGGGLNCLSLLNRRGAGFLVQFSSVNAWLGGANLSAFAGACSGIEALGGLTRDTRVQVLTLAWSPWELCGFERQTGMVDALAVEGFKQISRAMGMASLLLGMYTGAGRLVVGADLSHPRMAQRLANHRAQVAIPRAYLKAPSQPPLPTRVQVSFENGFGVAIAGTAEWVKVEGGEEALRARILGRQEAESAVAYAGTAQVIADIWKQILGVAQVGLQDNFFELGGHSLSLIQVQARLQEAFDRDITMVTLFQHATVAALTDFFDSKPSQSPAVAAGLARAQHRKRMFSAETHTTDIAVIGMGCRFPGANDVTSFWQNLCDGAMTISRLTEAQLAASGVDPAAYLHPNYVKWMPTIENPGHFDAGFFGYSAREAELIDPQQRIMLEVAWEAMEDGGYPPGETSMPVGVFAGATTNTYLMNNVMPNRDRLDGNDDLFAVTLDSMGGFQLMVANDKDYLTTRLSYKLNLSGPSINVQTACSTSLVAVHQACQSLLSGECDMALAGGVTVNAPEHSGHLYQEGMIVTPDGLCRAFDAQAEGTIFGSGAGVVLLKRLDQAVADGDHVYAVVKGTACNNDGGNKVGYMAPSGDGQAATVSESLAFANIDPATVSYVEAHGTGTPMGDPIEFNGLTTAFRDKTPRSGYCALGSVKTNLGHLQIASGIVGFMKTVLCLKHRKLVASLHFENPNPAIDFEASPFYVNTEYRDWEPLDENGQVLPRRAGVNSLGIGGTNAHVILEEAPLVAEPSNKAQSDSHLFTLSAKSEKGLKAYAANYLAFLERHPQTALADLCYSQNSGRGRFSQRLALVVKSKASLHNSLKGLLEKGTVPRALLAPTKNEIPRIAWVFTGQGDQFVGMGKTLYATQPLFRAAIDRCSAIADAQLGLPLTTILFEDAQALTQTENAQPAIFALAYGLATLWQSWGLAPGLVLGHSVGEYAGAVAAGVLHLEEALNLIIVRAKAMQALPQGGMLSVAAEEFSVRQWITTTDMGLNIAAVNGPQTTVVAGEQAAIEDFADWLQHKGVRSQRLAANRAYHGDAIMPAMAELFAAARQIRVKPSATQIIANTTGMFATHDFGSANYWVSQASQPVRFSESVQTLISWQPDLVIEMGPKPSLLTLLRQQWRGEQPAFLPSLRQNRPAWHCLFESLGKAYMAGAKIDWSAVYASFSCQKLPLPTYPFQGQRHWLAPQQRLQVKPEQVQPAVAGLYQHKMIASPLLEKTVFESVWSLPAFPELKDHKISDQVVIPGAAYVTGVISAAFELLQTEAVQLENALISAPLLLGEDQPQTVQIALAKGTGSRHFKVISTPGDPAQAEREDWITHFEGRFSASDLNAERAVSLKTLQQRCQNQISGETAHDRVIASGIQVGPAFRCIQTCFLGAGEVLAKLVPPQEQTPVHHHKTALLDSALQTVLVGLNLSATETLVPFQIESLVMKQWDPQPLWVHCQQLVSDDATRIGADLMLFDEAGDVLGRIAGFKARRMASAHLNPALVKSRQWLYDLAWEKAPVGETREPSDCCWLIISDQSHLDPVHLQKSLGENIRRFTWAENPSEALKTLARETSTGKLWRVILDVVQTANSHRSENFWVGGQHALTWLQALNSTLGDGLTHVFWHSHGAFSVGGEDRGLDPFATAFAGWVQALHQEYPQQQHRFIDLPTDRLTDMAWLKPEWWRSSMETWVVYRFDEAEKPVRWIPKLKRQKLFQHPEPMALDPSATYLITGGLTGLGWLSACHLVEKGAHNLILVGRRTPQPHIQARLDQWIGRGNQVAVVQVDITTDAGQKLVVQAWRKQDCRLGGVIHAAGILDDAAFFNLDWAQFQRVLAPKVLGAQWLATFCRNAQPDFVAFYASIAGMLGSAGQTHYAAANMYLDAIAHQLTQTGINALAIHWGPWRDVGMAHDHQMIQHLHKKGIDAVPTDTGLALLDRYRGYSGHRIVIAPLSWAAFTKVHRELDLTLALKPRAEDQPKQPLAAEPASLDNLARKSLSKDDLATVVKNVLHEILGLDDQDPAQMDKGFFDMGLDSLSSVDLRNRLQKQIGENLPQTLAFDYPTLDTLVDFLYERFFTKLVSAQAEPWEPTVLAAEPPPTTRDYDGLSEEEAAALLDDRLAEIDGLLEGV